MCRLSCCVWWNSRLVVFVMCRGTICCDFIQLCTSYGHRRISNSVRLVLVLLKQRDGGDLSKEMAAIDVAVPDQAGSVRIEPDYVHITRRFVRFVVTEKVSDRVAHKSGPVPAIGKGQVSCMG